MVITDGNPTTLHIPDDVTVVAAGHNEDAFIEEVVAGRTWRVSARSFFQTSHVGAEALVAAVRDGLGSQARRVVDLYCGVGLLGGATAAGALVAAVESNPSSVADARHNLDAAAHVVHRKVERWQPLPADAAIADPARRGLGRDGAEVIDQTGASRLVLVSCDPASLGRDTALLIEQGWSHDYTGVIDMFPDTSRIEAVTTFSR